MLGGDELVEATVLTVVLAFLGEVGLGSLHQIGIVNTVEHPFH